MKKIYFALFILAGALAGNSQTTSWMSPQHAPAVGDTYTTTGATVGPAGSSGTGQTWNFSTVTSMTPTLNYSVVTAASTGSASSYPSASVSAQSGSNNTFYSSTTSQLKLWGGKMTISGVSFELRYTTPAIVATYPLAYNVSSNSSIAGDVVIPSLPNGSFTGNCALTADGTGTLVLPMRTFTNALRVITTQTVNYTIPLAGSGVVTLETIDYYSLDYPKTPMYSISNATLTGPVSGSQSAATLRGDYTYVGIKEQTKEISNLKLYPNPAKGIFNISFMNENGSDASYELINALGQVIRKDALGNEKGIVKYPVSLDGVDSGIYFVKIKTGNSSSVQKITIQ